MRLAMGCSVLQARLALAAGSSNLALFHAQRALAAAKSVHSEDPITDHYQVALTYRILGDVLQQSGDRDGALRSWADGLSQLPAKVAERPFEMDQRLQLLRRLDRLSEAAPLQARLNAIGYRGAT
jgi:predicted negative regulator of RcsB-dependent stress response